MFYVIVVNQDGSPNKLFGPLYWNDVMDRVLRCVALEKANITEQDMEFIEMYRFLEFEDGGGVYTIQAEQAE